MTDPIRFVIVGMQRSGTTVTQQCVSRHPDASCPEDEVTVDPFFTRGMSVYTVRGREGFERRSAGHRHLFEAITAPPRPSGETSFGLKVAVDSYQSALDLYIGLVEHLPDVRVVLVERGDLVAQFASLLLARRTGRWHRHGAGGVDHGSRVRPDPAEFEEYVIGCRRIYDLLGGLSRSHRVLRFRYESDIAPGVDHRKLFEFVGLRDVEPTWLRMRKVSPPVEELVAGLDGLRAIEERVAPRPEGDPMPDVLDRISANNRGEDAYFLVHRAHARIERGWIEPAKCDLRSLVDRAAELEVDLAGRAHGYAEHLGVDPGALAEGRDGDGVFLVSRGAALAVAGRGAQAFGVLADAIDRDPGGATPEWLVPISDAVEALARAGELDAELERLRAARRAAVAAVFEVAAERRRGDVDGARAALARARLEDPALVDALGLGGL